MTTHATRSNRPASAAGVARSLACTMAPLQINCVLRAPHFLRKSPRRLVQRASASQILSALQSRQAHVFVIILLYQITIKRNGRRHTHSALTGIRSGRRHTHMTQPNREWRVLIHRTRPARKVRNRAIEDRATHIPRWRQGVAAGQTNKRQQRAQGRLLYTMLCSSQIAKGVHAQCQIWRLIFR